ncbi:DUF3376 domain-containing protein [Streptomyces sp. NPDC050523]|uniref:DUF3376 domain-containing protein n=1 Tax=Streptomyces sp. NPDC050523 TaxID=3365622 RepID=UPI0037AF7BA2
MASEREQDVARHSGLSRQRPSGSAAVQETEIRLALVMNGGVSLAVWMGGVTHEIDLLCRASSGEPPPKGMDALEEKVFEIWRRLAAGKRVKVDIISGTSAGGLNGLLLATAIGRGALLPNLWELWRTSASLEELQPSKSDRPQERSVLSGRNFERKIGDALNAIQSGAAPSNEPVTLFVTATALDGPPRRFKDSFEHGGFENEFDVRDHRRMYCFKNQPTSDTYSKMNGTWSLGGKEIRHFTRDNHSALLRAARSTASFPGAFEPVSEGPLRSFREKSENLADQDYQPSCLMDGGVLNNAPFGPVLEEITKRRVNDTVDVDRILVYVVPSSGRRADEDIKNKQCQVISPLTAAWKALHYPQEVDFRTGVEDLKQRLQSSFREAREELFERMLHLDKAEDLEYETRNAATLLLGEYRRSRVKAVVLEVLDDANDPAAMTILATPPPLDQEAIEEILLKEHSWFPPATAGELRKPNLSYWRWGIIPAERLLQTLYFHLHRRVKSEQSIPASQEGAIAKAAKDIYDKVVKIIAINEVARAEEKRSAGSRNAAQAAELVHGVFTELNVPKEVGRLVREAAKSFLDALGPSMRPVRWTEPEDVVSALLIGEILTKALAPPSKVLDKLTPEFKFLRLGPDAMGPLFNDGPYLGDRKLYGIRFRHFGAFISEDWRRSDFAWGRLDAAHHLLSLLMPGNGGQQDERELHEAILAAALPQEANGDHLKKMRENLDELADSSIGKLLGNGRAKSLKPIGDSVLRLLTSKEVSKQNWPVRTASRLVWFVGRRWVLRTLKRR